MISLIPEAAVGLCFDLPLQKVPDSNPFVEFIFHEVISPSDFYVQLRSEYSKLTRSVLKNSAINLLLKFPENPIKTRLTYVNLL